MDHLLEREHLLAELADLIERARHGGGALAFVAGEAGSGKTSLVTALRRSLGDEVSVVVGACDPLSTPRPLSPLLDFAADADFGLGRLFSESHDRTEIFNRVLGSFKGTIRPTLAIIEDVHWADDGTLDFLRFVGRRIADSHAVVVCTYRDEEVGTAHALRAVLGQLSTLATTKRLVVPALSVHAVGLVVGEQGLDAEQVYAVTGGNAFYVTEVAAVGEGLPLTVRDAVLARLSNLGDRARLVVEHASIAPRALEIALLDRLPDVDLDAIDEATALGIVVAEGTSLRFRHELARSATESAIAVPRRMAMHHQMLDLLADSEDTARLAHHAVRAGDRDRIVELAPKAARQAVSRDARKEAAEFFAAALDHDDLLDAAARAALHFEYATALASLGRNDESEAQYDAAATEHERLGDVRNQALALAQRAGVQWRRPDPEGAAATLSRAAELAEPLGPSKELAEILVRAGYLQMLRRRREAADGPLHRADSMAAQVDASDVASLAAVLLACDQVATGDADAGLARLEELRGDAEKDGDTAQHVLILGMIGSGGGETRHYEQAQPALLEGAELAATADIDHWVGYNRAWTARIAFETGEWDEVSTWAERAMAPSLGSVPFAAVTANGAVGRLRVRRGDPGGVELLREASMTPRLELQHVWPLHCGLAEAAWLAGDHETIAELIGDLYDRALATDSPWAQGEVGYWMWKAGAIDTPSLAAAEPYALQMQGEWRAAADEWRTIGCPYEVGLALSEGDHQAQLEAVEIFDSLGARPAATRVRASLKESGVSAVPRGPIRSTAANPAGLTNRQMEVLELVAAGLSNEEIATQLFLSKRTVEHHVSAVLAKLDVDSRTRAVSEAVSLGIVQI